LFTITGDDGGMWTVDLKEEPGVREGDDGTAQCKIEISADDWRTVSDDPGTAMNMFMTGKLRVSGDVMLATKLQQVLRA
jgi:putative sterol carrier protein